MPGIVLAEGVVEVTADARGVPRAIAKDIEDGESVTRAAGDKVGKQVFGGIIGAWAAIGGTQIIADFFTGSITGASDLNETLSKSSQIFGANSTAIESFGNNAARNVGLSKEAAIAAAAGFGDMFTQLGFATDAAAAMSQQVVIAAADLGSFNNLETADVADRISAAFRGEYDSLQAVIPNINAARVESEALAMTGKTVASELTAQEKAAAVLAIVQKDGARAMGDFERTSDGAANKQKILTAELEDQTTRLGSALLPAWTDLLGVLTDVAVPAFSWLIDNMPLVGSVLGGLAAALLVAFAPAIWGAVTAAWAFTAALLANPITWVIIGITALVAGIIWLATQTTFFQDVWTNVTNAIGTAWEWLWTNVLSPVFTAIADIFTWIYNNIIMPIVTGIMIYIGLWAAVITWLWEAVLSPVFAAIADIFTWIYNNIIMPIVTGIMIYIGLWAAVITWLWEAVLSPVFAAIGAVFQWIWANVIAPVVGFIQAAIRGVGIVFQWLYSSIIQPVFAAVGAAFNWVWKNVISPVVNSISGAIRNVGNVIRDVFGGIGSFIGSAFQAALDVVRGPINGIIGLVNSAIRGLNSLSVTIPDWVPIVGGQTWGLSIPTIPMLARGSKNAPDAFIAGEAGPELIVGAGGSKVYPADETRRIRDRDEPGDAPLVGGDLIINEAQDPLGSAGRVGAELRKWRKK